MLDAFTELKLTLDEPNENCPNFSQNIYSLTTNEGVD